MNPLRAALLCATVVGSAGLGHGQDLRVRTVATWAENLGRSSSPIDWRDSLITETAVTSRASRQLAPNLMATVGGEITGVVSPRFERLNQLDVGGRAAVAYKFGLGPNAPGLQADVALGRREARISDDDGWAASASLSVAQRFIDTLRGRATADWQQHYAAGETFDTHSQRLSAELTWDVTPTWSVTSGYGRQWADFTATASAGVWARALAGGLGAAIADYYNSTPAVVTDTFGPGWTTYRVEGEVELWWLEVSPALAERTSLALRYDSIFARNVVNVKYRQDRWTLGLFHRF